MRFSNRRDLQQINEDQLNIVQGTIKHVCYRMSCNSVLLPITVIHIEYNQIMTLGGRITQLMHGSEVC